MKLSNRKDVKNLGGVGAIFQAWLDAVDFPTDIAWLLGAASSYVIHVGPSMWDELSDLFDGAPFRRFFRDGIFSLVADDNRPVPIYVSCDQHLRGTDHRIVAEDDVEWGARP